MPTDAVLALYNAVPTSAAQITGDIPGSGMAAYCPKAIPIKSFSHDMEMKIVENVAISGVNRKPGRANHGAFVVTKQCDVSTPILYTAASSGKVFGGAIVALYQTNSTGVATVAPMMVYVMLNVI